MADKRIKILVSVLKEFTYDYNSLYQTEDEARDMAYDYAVEEGEIKSTSLQDVKVEDLEEECEGDAA